MRIPILMLTAVIGTAVVGLTACADMTCFSRCQRQARNSTSLVDFLYPGGELPPVADATPQLHLPLRIGLSFLPPNGAVNGPDAAQREALLETIRARFISRRFVAEIVVIPDYYLQGKRGFEGLQGVQRLYGVDLMALVSYDQVMHEDDNDWSLGYVTIVGAYVLKGTRHEVSTLVDLAVIDPATRSLVLRAGGVDSSHGNTTLIQENRELRAAAAQSFDAATRQMIEHFDTALTAFEGDVRSGKANVKVVSNQGTASGGGGGGSGGGGGGGGSFGYWLLLLMLPLTVHRYLRVRTLLASGAQVAQGAAVLDEGARKLPDSKAPPAPRRICRGCGCVDTPPGARSS
jgi:rhombotail lipoprotein